MIRVVVDDLAFLAVDAVLRPADEQLEPATPGAVRLDAQGGAALAAQRRIQMPLEAGAAVVTGGGDLAAPFVIHVVVQSRQQPVSRTTVSRSLTSAWQRAEAWQLGKLATSVVGTGPGGLPLEEAARLLVDSWQGGPADRELQIVVEQEEDRRLIESIVGRVAG